MSVLEVRVQGLVLVEDRILLARHVRHGRSYWVLPGGHREAGETLDRALARELEEEAGIRPLRLALFSVSEMLLDDREVLDLVFHVAEFAGEPRLGDLPSGAGDDRLQALALHPCSELGRLDFRPTALAKVIAAAWRRGEWISAGYLGNLAVETCGK
jgi:ADP-ribose pyrophosphatase YjhB (NUDIX family)